MNTISFFQTEHDGLSKFYVENLFYSYNPYCLFDGNFFHYKYDFVKNINKDFFEKYIIDNIDKLKSFDYQFKIIYVSTSSGMIQYYEFNCLNHFEFNRYLKTSFIKNEFRLNQFDAIKFIHSELFNENIQSLPSIDFENSPVWLSFWLFCFGYSRVSLSKYCNVSENTINKRLLKIKKTFNYNSLELLRFDLIKNGILFKTIPSAFKKNMMMIIA